MKFVTMLFETLYLKAKQRRNAIVLLMLGMTLILFYSPAQSFQFETIAMRNMNTFKKFDGVIQNALVIKSTMEDNKYFDRIEFASGELVDDEDGSFFVSVGPSWRFNKRISGSGIAFIEFGTSPTWIENGSFGDESLGGHLFFTSNVQLGMHFGHRRALTLSVRIHHISNGGLSSKNPGTDMVGIELSYALGR